MLVEQQTPGPAGGTALRADRVDPGELRRDQGASARSGSSSWRPAATAARTSTPRRCWAASTARCATPARSSAAPAAPTTRAALNFSSYGTRVDLQGWGEQITTTGSGGNLFGGTAPANLTRRYTRSFSGTSGAGPIVVNAIVAVQSYLKATGQPVYTARKMRDLLRRTGTPATGTRLMGPLPNLAAACVRWRSTGRP